MSPNFQSLCYLAAWEKGLPIEGGLAWEAQLRKCRLDYSWGSLDRIDQFLDALRTQRAPVYEEFLSKMPNTNLLVFLAFYVVELRSRVKGQPAQWFTFRELLNQDAGTAVYGEGFESCIISVLAGGQFLPLVSISTRLFETEPDKCVAFSAALFIDVPADKNKVFGPLAVPSLVDEFPARYAQSLMPEGYRRWIEAPVPREWANDALQRLNVDAPKLLRTGRVVWGAVVQANNHLYEPNLSFSAPAEVVYDPAGRVHRADLARVASRLYELKADVATQNPDLAVYGEHLRNEFTRMFAWRTPTALYPYELMASTTMFSSEISLPGQVLAMQLVPIVVSDECVGSVLVLPWQLWPADVFEEWNARLRSAFGERARIQFQPRQRPLVKLQEGPKPVASASKPEVPPAVVAQAHAVLEAYRQPPKSGWFWRLMGWGRGD